MQRLLSLCIFFIESTANPLNKFASRANFCGINTYMKQAKRYLFFTIISLLISATGGKVLAQRVGNPRVTSLAERESGDKFTISVRTPKGANVYAVRQPDAATLEAIDRGLDNLFAVARKNNYRARLNHSYYSIYIARPDRLKDSAGNNSPAIAVETGNFSGSEYDQGGFMYVAGMVFYLNPDSFLIVDYGTDFKSVSDIVRYEGEHIILYYNNRRLYDQTASHSGGGSHPILK
jgi:hypothetical protein